MANPIKWLSEALFGKGPGEYKAPQMRDYANLDPSYMRAPVDFDDSYQQGAYRDPGQAPTYREGEMETRLTGQLQDVIGGQLANYQNGRSLLPDAYRNSILSNARGRIDMNFADSANQVGEQLNRMNLLGGTGHVGNLQRLGAERANALGQYENQFLSQELGMLEGAQRNAMGLRESLQSTFDQRARDRFQGESQSYGMRRSASQGDYDRARQGSMDRYGAATDAYGRSRQGAMDAYGAGRDRFGAATDAAQQEYQARARQNEDASSKRVSLLGLGVGLAGQAARRPRRMAWPDDEDDGAMLRRNGRRG